MEENKQEEMNLKENEDEKNKSEGNMEWKNKARPAIYSMAGFYLAYLSYSMFKEISVTSGSERITMIVFSILFAVIGLGGILFGLMAGYKAAKEQQEKDEP